LIGVFRKLRFIGKKIGKRGFCIVFVQALFTRARAKRLVRGVFARAFGVEDINIFFLDSDLEFLELAGGFSYFLHDFFYEGATTADVRTATIRFFDFRNQRKNFHSFWDPSDVTWVRQMKTQRAQPGEKAQNLDITHLKYLKCSDILGVGQPELSPDSKQDEHLQIFKPNSQETQTVHSWKFTTPKYFPSTPAAGDNL
jgi:hypothetical protein